MNNGIRQKRVKTIKSFIFMQSIFMTITKEEINALTVTEKQQLLDMLWDSINIDDEAGEYDLEAEESEEEVMILNERLADYENNPSSAIPLDIAFERLKKRI